MRKTEIIGVKNSKAFRTKKDVLKFKKQVEQAYGFTIAVCPITTITFEEITEHWHGAFYSNDVSVVVGKCDDREFEKLVLAHEILHACQYYLKYKVSEKEFEVECIAMQFCKDTELRQQWYDIVKLGASKKFGVFKDMDDKEQEFWIARLVIKEVNDG